MREEEINRTTYSTPKALEVYTASYLWPYEEVMLDAYLKPGMKVLDIGCGTGRLAKFLLGRGARVVAIDMVENFISKAKELYPQVDFCVMNAAQLDFPDNFFDFVFFSNQGIDYTERREEVLREAYRVTKPGAVFTYSMHSSLALPRTWKAWHNFFRTWREWHLGPHFRIEHHQNGDLHVFHNNLWNEMRLLQKIGFQITDIFSNNRLIPRWPRVLTALFTRWPLIVCRKP